MSLTHLGVGADWRLALLTSMSLTLESVPIGVLHSSHVSLTHLGVGADWRLALLTRDTHLGVSTDWCLALLTGVGEQVLVALDAVGVLLAQDVAMARQRHVAVEAAEVSAVPVLLHRLGVLAREDQLSTHRNNSTVMQW